MKIKGSHSKYLKLAVGIVISAACIIWIFSFVDFQKLQIVLRTFEWQFLLFSLGALAFGYFFRILRWRYMLKSLDVDMSLSTCASPFLASVALNNVLPFRAGDWTRAFIIPKVFNITKAQSLSTLVVERIFDIVVLSGVLFTSLLMLDVPLLPSWIETLLMLLLFVSLAFLLLIIFMPKILIKLFSWISGRLKNKDSVINKLLSFAVDTLGQIALLSNFKNMMIILLLSILSWAFEGLCFYGVILGFSLSFGPLVGMLTMALATLSTLVPSAPGYIGPFHLAASESFKLIGANTETAVAFAILAHACVWVPTTLAGLLALILDKGYFKIFKSEKVRHEND
jgi:uncharacterized protein (TIRG00374 family)